MTPFRLLIRSLAHYRAVHCAAALGVAVAAAVLTGALVVGSSVRGSLRNLTLDRLGDIDFAAVGERYFREQVREAAAWPGTVSASILIRGTAEQAVTGARASQVRIHGVDTEFWQLYGLQDPQLGSREALINRRLADQLGAASGDSVLLRFHSDTLVPSESVMGRKSDNVRMVRLRVASVLVDSGPGRFGLSPQQQLPYNLFVPKALLERELDQPGRANALLVSGGSAQQAEDAWRDAFSAEDARLAVRPLPDGSGFVVDSERIVLDDAAASAVRCAAEQAGFDSAEVLTYLANAISAQGRSVPYSTVTALESPPDSLLLLNGARPEELDEDEILLNSWAASDLGARPGDSVSLTYYVVGPGSTLETSSAEFRLAGIAAMTGAALDRDYAPTYRGMTDQTRMGDWDPPFPVDLRLIRPRDEEYWDRHRAAPKAFLSLSRAKRLWTSRFGRLTSIRIAPRDTEASIQRFRAELASRLDPADFGLALQPVKETGLEAASGATDFSSLFLGFSMFLIASAAILVALLFRLGVERRAREIGALLATGHAPRFVRRMLLAEGAVLAAAGCLLGLPGAVAYAALMLHGLSTWWSGAVGGSFLELHWRPLDLLIGASSALALMLVSIWLSLRKLTRLSPHALLAGVVEPPARLSGRRRRARRLKRIAVGAGLAAAALVAVSAGGGPASRLAAFFGAGTLALVAALVAFRARLLAGSRSAAPVAGLAGLGFRNSGRNPTRSMLSTALVACACFMIVTVAMNRQDVSEAEPAPDSGDGGFRWVADADGPLFQDAIDGAARGNPSLTRIFPMRVRAGEDASCLNLYQPTSPTLASAPPSLIDRGGFRFQQTLAETAAERENPWLLLDKDFGGAIPVFGDANSATWILHLAPGDELEVEDGSGRSRRLVLAGVLARSIFQSELLLSESRFLELFADHSGYQKLLVETDDEGAAAVLEDAFADQGLDAIRTADQLAGFLVVENTYLSTFRTLGGLGLLLGTLGLAVVMARTALERRGELALLEAVGFAPRSISRLLFAENALLLVYGMGAGSAAALLAVAPHLASGSASPPWLPLAGTLGGIVALGLLAGAAAARLSLGSTLVGNLRRD